jgi:hypothetical protein
MPKEDTMSAPFGPQESDEHVDVEHADESTLTGRLSDGRTVEVTIISDGAHFDFPAIVAEANRTLPDLLHWFEIASIGALLPMYECMVTVQEIVDNNTLAISVIVTRNGAATTTPDIRMKFIDEHRANMIREVQDYIHQVIVREPKTANVTMGPHSRYFRGLFVPGGDHATNYYTTDTTRHRQTRHALAELATVSPSPTRRYNAAAQPTDRNEQTS